MEDNKEVVNEVKEEEIELEEVLDENDDNLVEEVISESESESVEDTLATVRNLKDENKKMENENQALKDRLLRISAEYENYRKRTSKEKDGIYTDACNDVVKEILPVVDNLERALAADGTIEDLKKGLEMTIKGVETSFEKLGLEVIDTDNGFDPNLHQAVMHIQDENFDKNSIVEVFMKGYKKGDKVIRYSMVKVAN